MEVAGPILVFAVVGIVAIAIFGAMSNQADNGTVKDSQKEIRITSVQKIQKTPHNIENNKADF